MNSQSRGFERVTRVVLAMLMLGGLSACAQMSAQTITAEALWQAVHVEDLGQTLDIRHSSNPTMHESANVFDLGWVIGERPPDNRIWEAMGAEAVGHFAITALICKYSPGWGAMTWEGLTIAFDGAIVKHNAQLGLSARF